MSGLLLEGGLCVLVTLALSGAEQHATWLGTAGSGVVAGSDDVDSHALVDTAAAARLARELLSPIGDRWWHVRGAAAAAITVRSTVDIADQELLVAAAWLHDIGYAPALSRTGSHALDGARFLRSQGWPDRVCGLVAHHSYARLLVTDPMLLLAWNEFSREEGPVADALVYADMNSMPNGGRAPLRIRLSDVRARHATDEARARLRRLREPLLTAAVERVIARCPEPRHADCRDPRVANR